jgi:hypothetical protein
MVKHATEVRLLVFTDIHGDFPGALEKLGDEHHKRSAQYFGNG